MSKLTVGDCVIILGNRNRHYSGASASLNTADAMLRIS